MAQVCAVITALILAGVLDPNCIPRHAAHLRAFSYTYHSHYYHAPLPPACRDPWPEVHLQELHLSERPPADVPAGSADLGHSPAVVWPGYVPNPPPPPAPRAHGPHGGPGARPVVSVPEPSTLALWSLGLAALGALRRR